MSIRYSARHVREDLDQASLPRCHLFGRTCLTSLTSLNRPSPGTLRNPVQISAATSLVRGQTDLVVVAELVGHSRLDTARQYSLPTEQDKADALNHLTTDH